MKLIFLLFLSSCTISYYYKGKDIVKNQNKIDKQITKSLKNFDQINRVDTVVNKLKKSEFKDKNVFLTELRLAKGKCLAHKKSINNIYSARKQKYNKLNIQKKKKYSSKDKNYKEIKTYIDGNDKFSEKLETQFKQAKKDCNQIQSVFSKYDVKMMNANKLYGKFKGYEKTLKQSDIKVKKQLAKFRKKLSKSKHKNKSKINNELTKMDDILIVISKELIGLGSEVKSLKSIYGTKGDIPIVKGSEAYLAVEKLNKKSKSFNKQIDSFNEISNKINDLIKDK